MPRVIVNCAMSVDGKIASRVRKQVRLSDESDMARVHKLRNDCDAILVGVGTVIADDPSLLVKEKYVENPRQPIRIILDSKCRTPPGSRVLDGKSQTIIFTTQGHEKQLENAEIIACGTDMVDIKKILAHLDNMGIKTLLVEGGGTIIWSFVSSGFVDEFKVFINSKLIGGGQAPTPMDGNGFADENEFPELNLVRSTMSDSGILLEFLAKDTGPK
ncbi:MAG: 2,5-diamino-6-(ribosylamino)-4(3H)-pyrimidinone 5'-phosphate reductase [Thermoplasmata archaeon]|nr:2,5-diamino-6-(ribosylamino)-4(3H)-pyrimidinone 5'-phosphate reductase [Thermoplasmata archaeon]